MANSTIDKINELISKGEIINKLSDKVNDTIHDIGYSDTESGLCDTFILSNECKKQYYALVKRIYDTQKQYYSFDTIDKKFYKFLYSIKKQNRLANPSDYSRFYQKIQNEPIRVYKVFHEIKGIEINNRIPLKLFDYCIYNTNIHQSSILKTIQFDANKLGHKRFVKELKKHNYWISVEVASKEFNKAKEVAYKKFEIFQSICRYLLAFIGNVYCVGILNDKDTTFDDYLAISDDSVECGSKRVNGRYKNIDINCFLFEYKELFDTMLNIACKEESTEISRRIVNAIVFYGRAEQEENNTEKQLLYIMSIEALLENDTENIVENVSNNVAVLLSITQKYKNDIKKEFKKIYSKRSSVTHGSEIYLLEDDVKLAQRYALDIIYEFLTDNAIKNMGSNTELFSYIAQREIELKEKEVQT